MVWLSPSDREYYNKDNKTLFYKFSTFEIEYTKWMRLTDSRKKNGIYVHDSLVIWDLWNVNNYAGLYSARCQAHDEPSGQKMMECIAEKH